MKRSPSQFGFPSMLRPGALMLAVTMAIGCLWFAHAAEPNAEPDAGPKQIEFKPEEIEAAKKHADFETLASAKTIVIGKIRVRIDGVDEIFPPVYHLTMFVTPTEVIAGDFEVEKRFTVRFFRRGEEEPKFADVPYLIAVGDEDDPKRLLLLKPVEEDLPGIAKVAASYGAAQRERNAALARENPEMHPLFETLQKAKHVAVIQSSADPNGAVSFDLRTRLEERYDISVVASLRGDLKPGVLKRLAFTEEAAQAGQRDMLIAIVEFRDGQPVVTQTLRADEEELRVAAAATKVDPAVILKKTHAAEAEHQRQIKAARSRELFRGIFGGSAGSSKPSEPSEGASTPSFDGGIPTKEEFEQDAP